MERNAPLTDQQGENERFGCSPRPEGRTGAKVTAEASEAKTRTGLKPNRRIRGVVAGLMPMLPTNTAATMTPAFKGSQPKPSWNIRGSRNGTELMVRR